MKKILLTSILSLPFIAFSGDKECSSFDDIYGIELGCPISNLAKTKALTKIMNTADITRYEVEPLEGFNNVIITSYSPDKDQIALLMLTKSYSKNDISVIKEDVLKIIDDIENKWGEIEGKEDLINLISSDLNNINFRTFNSEGWIRNPNAKFLEKIRIEISTDDKNMPTITAIFFAHS